MSRYTFSFLFFISAPIFLFGQAGKWAPSAVRVGTDPGALGYWIFSEQRNFFEVTADMDVDNFYVAAGYGTSSYTLQEPTYAYSNNGSYLRLGMDVNIMKQDKEYNVMFIGFRYAMSDFNDKLEYQTDAVLQTAALNRWPSSEEEVSNNSQGANWIEFTTGLRMRVYKQLYMGFTARYKFLKKDKGGGALRPYYIPGFGKNIDKNTWGLNYYIYYRFPFRKKVVYVEDES